jgi:TetR/AcrR family transcriptional repressor of bet genes
MARKRMPEEVRRRQLLEAAFTVASREGIGGVTIRAVAAQADVSHGLVLFYFGKSTQLVHELLDWLLENAALLRVSSDIARFPRAADRLHALLEQEVARVSQEPAHTRLLLEFWALGAQDEGIRTRMKAELERYRAAFLAIIEEMLQSEPTRRGVTAAGLSAVAVSWIQGCAVQALIDPEHFDTAEYLAAVRAVIAKLG